MASTKVVFLASIMAMILGSSLPCDAASRSGDDFVFSPIGTRCNEDPDCNLAVLRNDCQVKACINKFCFCKIPPPTSRNEDNSHL
ncbi:hypothetical protein C2S52_022421 [Perilla frutescens var. hirtella]|nr:hypothetical protein C2S52_022421 [Perilla frutescens var. hirtella]